MYIYIYIYTVRLVVCVCVYVYACAQNHIIDTKNIIQFAVIQIVFYTIPEKDM